MNSADYDARTALHLAVCENHLGLASHLRCCHAFRSCPDVAHYLLLHNADPDSKDRYQLSPRDYANKAVLLLSLPCFPDFSFLTPS